MEAARRSVLIALSIGLCACAQVPPQPTTRQRTLDATATVEAIDRQTRIVSLRGPDGRNWTVYAGPGVRNFDQIQLGDEVAITFYAAVAAEVTTPDRATRGVHHEAELFRAEKGARPAGGISETLTTTVEIDSVDTSLNTVTFRRADGFTRVLAVEDPEMQTFIRGLKRGDLVHVTYMEAVAVSVHPTDRS